MITANFTREARLGNQLFQYSVMRSVAEKNGFKFYVNPYFWLGGSLVICNLGENDGVVQHRWVDPITQAFNPEIFKVKDFTALEGYFQTDKYFTRDDIKRWFKINYPPSTYDFLKQYPVTDYCYINVRGTDQAQFGHLILPEEYYTKAMSIMHRFNDRLKFVVITDDEPFAKKKFPNFPVFSNDRDVDFSLLNAAIFVIGAQSTFFWWAAYLNEYNIVIAPARWFHYHYPNMGWVPVDINTNKFIWK